MAVAVRSINFSLWVATLRLRTLVAIVAPVTAGLLIAWLHQGSISLFRGLLTLLTGVFIQIATNCFNDYCDDRRGADKKRKGPVRALMAGAASRKQILMVALAFLALACLTAVPLLFRAPLWLDLFFLLSLFLSYGYTGGPYPLAYRGLGEIFAFFFFGCFPAVIAYYLQTGTVGIASWLAGAQFGLLSALLLAANNLRDYEGDRRAKKKTLAVRFGFSFVLYELLALQFAPFLLSLFWLPFGLLFTALLPLALLPQLFRSAPLLGQAVVEKRSSAQVEFFRNSAQLLLRFSLFFFAGILMDAAMNIL